MSVIVGRSRIATKYGIVAASQPLAARAGVQILERGGNAIDAAIATNAVMGLVEPQSNGIGGDLFAIVYEAATDRLHGLNSGGWAPAGLSPAILKAAGMTEMPQSGIHSVTVPGAVAGWDALRTRLGRLSMAELMAPAIFYAEDGFPVSDVIAAHWQALAPRLAAAPNAAATYLPNGRAPRGGELFRNADLASSLRRVAAHGCAGFYDGPTAEAILAISRQMGGTMTSDDLMSFAPEWVAPISTNYRGWDVYELPPNTQGIAALMMLNLMERFPLGEYGFHSTQALHVLIEAKKLAYADMLNYVGDMNFTATPVPAMLDKAHAAARAGRIDSKKAARHVEPSVFDGLTTATGGDTIYLSVVDRDGNIVSLIQSIYEGFGSCIACRPDAVSRSTTAARCSRSTRRTPTRSRRASGRCTPSSPASCETATSKSASASWAGSTRLRPTLNSSPTSSTTAWTFSRRSRRDDSRRRRLPAPTSALKPWCRSSCAASCSHSGTKSRRSRRGRVRSDTVRR